MRSPASREPRFQNSPYAVETGNETVSTMQERGFALKIEDSRKRKTKAPKKRASQFTRTLVSISFARDAPVEVGVQPCLELGRNCEVDTVQIMSEQVQPVPNVYAMFCGGIDQNAVQRIMAGVNLAGQKNVQHIHILFQSSGGTIGDGVCLYNFLKNATIEVSLYNVGTISSIAVLAYLGATNRKASTHSTFMIHRSTMSPPIPTAERLQAAVDSLKIDDARTEIIYRGHIKIPDEKWSDLRHNEFWFTAQDAVKNGIASEIAEFAPPKGTHVSNL
jgi:ATP-dependent Clp protease, protease subunit